MFFTNRTIQTASDGMNLDNSQQPMPLDPMQHTGMHQIPYVFKTREKASRKYY